MNAPAPAVKYFTLEDAIRTLPLVKLVARDISELFSDVERRRERLVTLRLRGGKSRQPNDPYEEEVRQMEEELEADVERLREFISELTEIGVELKDPVSGLLDFRTLVDGREAYLCWRLGEETIDHWHELDAGFAGRREITGLDRFTAESPAEADVD